MQDFVFNYITLELDDKGYYISLINLDLRREVKIRITKEEAEEFRVVKRISSDCSRYRRTMHLYLEKKKIEVHSCFISFEDKEYVARFYMLEGIHAETLEPDVFSGICDSLLYDCNVYMDKSSFYECSKSLRQVVPEQGKSPPKSYSLESNDDLPRLLQISIDKEDFEASARVKKEMEMRGMSTNLNDYKINK